MTLGATVAAILEKHVLLSVYAEVYHSAGVVFHRLFETLGTSNIEYSRTVVRLFFPFSGINSDFVFSMRITIIEIPDVSARS